MTKQNIFQIIYAPEDDPSKPITYSILVETNILNQLNEEMTILGFQNPAKSTRPHLSKQVASRLYNLRKLQEIRLFVTDLNLIELYSSSIKHYREKSVIDLVYAKIIPNPKTFYDFWMFTACFQTYLFQKKIIRRTDFKDFYIYSLTCLAKVDYVVTNDKAFKAFYNGFLTFKKKLVLPYDLEKVEETLLQIKQAFGRGEEFGFDIKKIIQELILNPTVPLKAEDFVDPDGGIIELSEIDQVLERILGLHLLVRTSLPFSLISQSLKESFEEGEFDYEIREELAGLIEIDKKFSKEITNTNNLIIKTFKEQLDIDFDSITSASSKKELINCCVKVKITENQIFLKTLETLEHEAQRLADKVNWQYEVVQEFEEGLLSFLRFKDKKFGVICDNCGHKQIIVVQFIHRHEIDPNRQMGPEFESIWETECECRECNAQIVVRYTEWEYPEGIVNDYDKEIEGATFVDDEVD